jgi:hypothetical protein
MKLRSLCPCLALAALLGGSGAFSFDTLETQETIVKTTVPVHVKLRPLGDLIARGEGNWNSVNRGWAGDTPGGIQRLTGKTFDQYTVKQVMAMQRGWLYAVGRYQFIPRTLRFAVSRSSVSLNDRFTPEVQDRLMAALIMHKRPTVGDYLVGRHDNVRRASVAMAKEWASIEYRYGRSFYQQIGGNRAHITRAEIERALRSVKASWHSH